MRTKISMIGQSAISESYFAFEINDLTRLPLASLRYIAYSCSSRRVSMFDVITVFS